MVVDDRRQHTSQEPLVDSRDGLLMASATHRMASHSDDELPAVSPTYRGGDAKGVVTVQSVPRPKNGVVCRVTLLDGNECQVEIEKTAKGQDLLDRICQQLCLLEKDYFSCTFRDTGDVKFWLNPEKRINKQLKGRPWIFAFEVKFYPTEPAMLQEDLTRYLLCLQLRADILSGKLPCSFVTHSLLGSYTIQSDFGDYDVDEHGHGIEYIRRVRIAPNQTDELLDKVAELHRMHRGQSPAEAELNFLENAKKLAMYGVHLHDAKDKEGVEIMIGVCAAGLLVYRDKLRINRFAWPKILKIAYKRNNFYIKVRPGEFNQPHCTTAYKLSNLKMAKRLWKIAVEHHAFFRLREPEPPQRNAFPFMGSKFRYSGRTQYQTRNAASTLGRQVPTIDRVSRRQFPNSRSGTLDRDRDGYGSRSGTLDRGTMRTSSEPLLSNSPLLPSSPTYSTERTELFQTDEVRTATLDLKGRKPRLHQAPHTPVPFADVEDDNSLSPAAPYRPNREAQVTLLSNPVGVSSMTPTGSRAGSSMGYSMSPYGTVDHSQPAYSPYGRPHGHEGPYSKVVRDDDELPPYQDDLLAEQGYDGVPPCEGQWGPYIVSMTPEGRVWTRTYTSPDGTVITEYKSEKDGVVETRIEKRVVLTGNVADFDHDKALADAIRRVTDMNPDLSVEKIEIQATTERRE